MSIIEIGGQQINYRVEGSGRDVILLHGWGCDMNIFNAAAARLQEDFRVYAIDFPGFGQSAPPATVWGVEDYTQMLENFIRELGITAPILIGHSFGGRVAILYASRNSVNKVILVDAAGVKPRRSMQYYVKVYSYKAVKRILPLVAGRKKAEEILEQYRRKSGSSDYNATQGIMRSVIVKVVNEDLKHVMPLITAPTLLVWGENDTATTVRDAQIINKLIKDSGLVVLKNAGHFSFLDKPYDFDAIVSSFLSNDKTLAR